jgi:hypothetical protein
MARTEKELRDACAKAVKAALDLGKELKKSGSITPQYAEKRNILARHIKAATIETVLKAAQAFLTEVEARARALEGKSEFAHVRLAASGLADSIRNAITKFEGENPILGPENPHRDGSLRRSSPVLGTGVGAPPPPPPDSVGPAMSFVNRSATTAERPGRAPRNPEAQREPLVPTQFVWSLDTDAAVSDSARTTQLTQRSSRPPAASAPAVAHTGDQDRQPPLPLQRRGQQQDPPPIGLSLATAQTLGARPQSSPANQYNVSPYRPGAVTYYQGTQPGMIPYVLQAQTGAVSYPHSATQQAAVARYPEATAAPQSRSPGTSQWDPRATHSSSTPGPSVLGIHSRHGSNSGSSDESGQPPHTRFRR